MTKMRLVILESPYAAPTKALLTRNILYARCCIRHSLSLGEAPIASHLLYTQEGILDDTIPHERQQGIDAGLAWRAVAEASVVYVDFGISTGMRYGVANAKIIEERYLPKEFWSAALRATVVKMERGGC